MAFYNQLKIHLEAGVPAIYVETAEWSRFDTVLLKCCKKLSKNVRYWNPLAGLEEKENLQDFLSLIDHLYSKELKHNITVLEYADRYFNDPESLVRFGVLLRKLRDKKHQIIVVAPTMEIPVAIQKEIAILDFPLPDRSDIKKLLNEVKEMPWHADCQEDADPETIQIDDGDPVLDAVRGLGTTEIRNAFAKVAVDCKKITAEEIPLLVAEKEQIIRKSGYLEFVPTSTEMSAIGGLEKLKEWLGNRKIAFGAKAREHKLDAPKGVLLLGIPGTGKSLSAKAVACAWKKPLLRLDMGRIFGGIVGESEANMRNAIKTAESLEPCVLWIDEIEKGFSGGASAGGERDGGTATRVFGAFLTWMQEKDKEVFVFATANNIAHLPPELLRKGRFDEIFFVDLPDQKARKSIFKIHLKRKAQRYEVSDELLKKTEGFSGAEIEAIVNEALFIAHGENKNSGKANITAQNLLSAAENIVPLSTTMHNIIEDLRKWAEARCRLASDGTPPKIRARTEAPRLRQESSNPFVENNSDD